VQIEALKTTTATTTRKAVIIVIVTTGDFKSQQEYVLWNAVSVPLLHFARYCSIVQTLSLKYPGRDLDLEVT